MSGPLDGVRVVDLSNLVAGPVCTRLLASYGADVVKVERPGVGDPARRLGPFPGDVPHPEKSGLFLTLNVNKRGVTLDLAARAGRRLLHALLDGADILVESFRPGTMRRLGLDPDELRRRYPRLTIVSISNFGQTGPYRDWRSSEIVAYGMGGAMCSSGVPEREPVKLGGRVIQYQAGSAAAVAALMGYYASIRHGAGDHVDLAILETQAASQDRRTSHLVAYQYTKERIDRRQPGTALGLGIRPTADGYVMTLGGPRRWEAFTDLIGHPEARDDPRFVDATERARPGRSDEFDIEYFLPWLLVRTMREASVEAQKARVPTAPVYDVDHVMADPVFHERGFWHELEHPEAGLVTHTGPQLRMAATPWHLRSPAPLLGQHNDEVYRGELGLSAQELARLRAEGAV